MVQKMKTFKRKGHKSNFSYYIQVTKILTNHLILQTFLDDLMNDLIKNAFTAKLTTVKSRQ